MNKKQLALVIGLGAVLVLLAVVVSRKQKSPYEETAREGVKLLASFDPNAVATLTIRHASNEVTMTKKDERWVVLERGGYPANFNNLSELLRKFWELKVARPLRIGPSRLPAVELAGVDKGSTLVEMKDEKGARLASLLLGAKSMREGGGDSGPFGGGGGWPNGRYVMVGGDIKTAALVADALTTVEPNPEHWINKDWFKVESAKLKSIAVTTPNATNNWTLYRDSETNEWKLADLKPGEQLDTAKLSGVTSALSSPSFNDVVTNTAPEKTGLDKATLAKLETFDGFIYDVKFAGKTNEDNFHFQVAVNGTIPKERSDVGTNETKEVKEKLDKEFKEKREKLEEKLKTEKAFAPWTYLVSKWTIDPLLKERKDLLAEKKEEPKPEAAKPAESTKGEAKPPSPTTDLLPSALRDIKVETKPAVKPPAPAPATTNKPPLPPLPLTNQPAAPSEKKP